MKRSEMVEYLQMNSTLELSKEVASYLLRLLEIKGMLPPHEDCDRMYTYDGRAGGHYDRVIFEWEKENEEK